ncbi:hypothetical protein AAVH_42093 [Aphelenchoides avenae]|nr:hypothetical protein AAVH_42093 [Aphelenchus avenae]
MSSSEIQRSQSRSRVICGEVDEPLGVTRSYSMPHISPYVTPPSRTWDPYSPRCRFTTKSAVTYRWIKDKDLEHYEQNWYRYLTAPIHYSARLPLHRHYYTALFPYRNSRTWMTVANNYYNSLYEHRPYFNPYDYSYFSPQSRYAAYAY